MGWVAIGAGEGGKDLPLTDEQVANAPQPNQDGIPVDKQGKMVASGSLLYDFLHGIKPGTPTPIEPTTAAEIMAPAVLGQQSGAQAFMNAMKMETGQTGMQAIKNILKSGGGSGAAEGAAKEGGELSKAADTPVGRKIMSFIKNNFGTAAKGLGIYKAGEHFIKSIGGGEGE